MKEQWIVSNRKLKTVASNNEVIPGIFFGGEKICKSLKENRFYYSGFILSRLDVNETIEPLLFTSVNFLSQLSEKVKGNFTLLKLNENSLQICNDHIGIHKFFWYESGSHFIVSNNLGLILQEITPEVNLEAITDHVLFNRFVDGKTLWKNVHFSGSATALNLSSSAIDVQQYWNYKQLTKTLSNDFEFPEIAERFSEITMGYIRQLKPERISVPMTGGFDCRSIIASLLYNDQQLVSYTYGHPGSADSVYGKLAANQIGLKFGVHFLGDDSEKYTDLRQEILSEGQSLASSHRAHRLHGIKEESKYADLMFLGYLGGEVIRGLWPDDLIISKPIRELWENKEPQQIINDAFNAACYEPGQEQVDYAIEKLQQYKLATLEESYQKVLFEIKAHLHYGQDLNLFSNYLTPVAFYLDLDYLEMIFRSKHNFLHKKSMTRNKLKKMDSPLFNSQLISHLWPDLAKVELGKGFSPYDFLNKRWQVYLKKGFRHYLKKPRFEPNYEYGAWYINMVNEAIELNDLENYFHLPKLSLNKKNHTEKEILHLTRIWDLSSLIKMGADDS